MAAVRSICLMALVFALISASGQGPAEETVITCLGDSVTEGAGSSSAEYTYPSQMNAILASSHPSMTFDTRNRGVAGYRAEDVIALLQNEGLPEDPDIVLLMIGGNDLATATVGTVLTIIDETVAEVQQCVNLIKAHTNADGSAPTLIISTFIPNLLYEGWGTVAIALYNDSLQDQSKLSGYDMMITSNYDDLLDPETDQAKESLMADAAHPNDNGYAVIAENWAEAIENYIAAPSPIPTGTPVPESNYINLEAGPPAVAAGEAATLEYICDFSTSDYRGTPVNIYLAAIREPAVIDSPSTVSEALSGGTVYPFAPGMRPYAYNGRAGAPTWRNVSFPPANTTGLLTLSIPASGYGGNYVFSTVFINANTGQYIRPDLPVENSNQFEVRP